MEELRFILKYVSGLLSRTDETWTRLAEPDCKEGQADYMLRCYYWPMMGVGALIIFLLHGNGVMLHSKLPFDAPFSLEYAMKGMVAFVLSYAAGPTLARLLLQQCFSSLTHIHFDKNQIEVFVHYCMSIVMLVELLCACLPYFTFLSFIGLYVIYIVYVGTDVYLKLQTARNFFMTLAAAFIYFSPRIISGLLAIFEK